MILGFLCDFICPPPLLFPLSLSTPLPSLSGVKNADEAELKQVASEPLELNVYNVNDFPLLSKLVGRLVRILCGKMEERSKTSAFINDPMKCRVIIIVFLFFFIKN